MDNFMAQALEMPSGRLEHRLFLLNQFQPNKDENRLDLVMKIQNFVENATRGRIWHLDEFHLNNLEGSTQYDDAIEDEEFIIQTIINISEAFPIAASLQGASLDPILILVGDYVPSWASDETFKHRFWLLGGKLHFIPIPRTPQELGKLPSPRTNEDGNVLGLELMEALECISHHSNLTLASKDMQLALKKALKSSPNIHKTRLHVSPLVAQVLDNDPGLISHAIKAFAERDPITIRKASKMETFGTDLVPRLTSISRRRFVELVSDKGFNPPKIMIAKQPPSPETEAWNRGMKVTTGFEMLLHDSNVSERLHKAMEGPIGKIHDGEGDDETWLHVALQDLETESPLSEADFRLDSDDESCDSEMAREVEALDKMLHGMKSFVNKESGLKGVDDEPEEALDFDPEKFLRALRDEDLDDLEDMDQDLQEFLAQEEGMSFNKAERGEEFDFSLIKNMLDSFEAQQGSTGPLTGLLGSLGVNLPKPLKESSKK